MMLGFIPFVVRNVLVKPITYRHNCFKYERKK